MIGSGMKKFAKENGMTVASGVAYGNYQGFAATFSEGSGYKRVDFATRFTDPVQKTMFMDALNGVNLQKTFRIQNLGVADKRIQIIFQDTVGTMNKIREFLNWFVPLLRQFGAAPIQICSHCGMEVTSGRWILMDGTAYFLHDACSRSLAEQINAGNAQRKAEDTGSYLTGFLGAVGGAIIGAVLWAVILVAGYVASLAGLVIGFLSQKGYDLLKGKQGKGKIAILIVAILLGVFLGTVGGYVVMLIMQEGMGYGIGAYIAVALEVLVENPGDLLLGLLFAGLGVFGILINAGKSVADEKFTYLK